MDKIEIIVGTYEEFLVGYRAEFKNEKLTLTQSFADRSHAGSVRCLSVSGKYVATGGADDRIFVYDMKQRNQSQILQHHEGTVNAVQFTPDTSHLLSVGSDGHFVAVRIGSWMVEGNWRKAHSGNAVTHLTCHPSGKLALTLGNDLILRTWNLVKGRVAYKTNIKGKKTLGHTPDCIVWSTEGNFFTVAGQRTLEIWSIQNADVAKTITTTSKPVCVCWIDDEHVIVGLENGKILIVSVNDEDSESTEDVTTIDGHSSRVKCLAYNGEVLVSAASSGEVKVWTIDLEKKELESVAKVNIGCRPTCLGILDTSQFGSDYWKDEDDVEEDEEKPIVRPTKKEKGVVVIEEEDGVADDDLIEAETSSNFPTNSKKGKNKKNKNKRKQSPQNAEEDENDSDENEEHEVVVKKKKFNKKNKQNYK